MGLGNDSKAGDRFLKLNMLIRDMAIRGSTDCLGPIDINWKACGRYIFVLIEEYTGKWWYRIFLSDEKFQYEKNRILYPAEEDDDLMYIYGYYENMNGTERELQMLKNGDWPYRIRVLAQKELCEEQNGICMRTAAEIWSDVLSYVKAHYHITDVVYKTWLEPLSISSFQNDGAITIMVPAEPPHAYEYVRRKFGGLLQETLCEVTGEEIPLNFGIKYYMTVDR